MHCPWLLHFFGGVMIFISLPNKKNGQKQFATLMLWSIFRGSQRNRKAQIRSDHLVINVQTPCHGLPGPPYLAPSSSPIHASPPLPAHRLCAGCAGLPPVPLGQYISNLFLPSDLTVPFAGLPLPSHVLEASSLSLLKVKVAQLCPTLCDPVDCSPPGSSSHGILQARILECGEPLPPPGDFPSPGTEPRSPESQGILYQWSPQGSPGPSPGDLPDPGIGTVKSYTQHHPTPSAMNTWSRAFKTNWPGVLSI